MAAIFKHFTVFETLLAVCIWNTKENKWQFDIVKLQNACYPQQTSFHFYILFI